MTCSLMPLDNLPATLSVGLLLRILLIMSILTACQPFSEKLFQYLKSVLDNGNEIKERHRSSRAKTVIRQNPYYLSFS